MKKYLLLLAMVISFHGIALAQSAAAIKGFIKDPNGLPMEAVTLSLYDQLTGKLVKISTTSKNGEFEIMNPGQGKFKLIASLVGFKSFEKENLEFNGTETIDIGNIRLEIAEKSLDNVTVVARKPMVEVKADKTVVNVDAFISNAGGTALDVLEKSPGVTVDRDGNISLKGKQGVIVLIDGKQTYLGGQDLANLLRNTASNQLEAVEIMTQPSAKYDASGNSGIINIRTKKGRQNGFNGSLNLSYIQAVYPKSPNSLNLNFKKDKVTVFTSLNYSYWEGYNDINIVRKFEGKDGDLSGSIFDQHSYGQFKSKNAGFRTGIEYAFSKNTSLGAQINGTYNPRDWQSSSRAAIYNGTSLIDSTNEAFSRNTDTWKNLGANINFRKRIDTTGREITADLDHIWYGSSAIQTSDNYTFYQPGNQLADSFLIKGELPSDIRIYSAKADYVHPIDKSSKLEAGLKSSFVKTDNDAQYTYWDAGEKIWKNDPGRSNHFLYEENINAAYINYSKEYKKWSFQTGLRMEHTHAKGKQLSNNENFRRNYVQLFPTAYLSYKLNEKNTVTANFGRRIERPNYQDMNPFQYFLDQYTFRMGNPYLQPQFSNNIEIAHNYKGVLNTTLNYSVTNDIINDIFRQNDSTKVTFLTKDNIAERKNVGIAISYNQPLTKWWTISVYGNAFHNKFNGMVNGLPLDVGFTSFMANMNNQFKFAKTWGGEISGFYRSKMQDGGLIVAQPMKVINFGLSKQVLKTKGTIKLNVNDPFLLQKFSGYTRFGTIDTKIRSTWDNRRVGMTFSYRFGKLQNGGPQRRRTGSATDEQNRVGNSNQ